MSWKMRTKWVYPSLAGRTAITLEIGSRSITVRLGRHLDRARWGWMLETKRPRDGSVFHAYPRLRLALGTWTLRISRPCGNDP
jgi:hypothetical protein